MRKPSPAMIVALVALFAALGGVGVAANGGSFILGHANSATLNTSLSAPVAGGKALQVTNTNTSNAASTALGLTVASGHAPFTVNSAVKVANLNADLLDGLDSTLFQRRVSGTCSSGNAIQTIATNGTVTCQATPTYSGTNFATSNQACPANQFDTGINSSGALQCAATPTYSGTNFATSNQACPADQFDTGINSSGALQCAEAKPHTIAVHYNGFNTSFPDVPFGHLELFCRPFGPYAETWFRNTTGGPLNVWQETNSGSPTFTSLADEAVTPNEDTVTALHVRWQMSNATNSATVDVYENYNAGVCDFNVIYTSSTNS